MAGMLLALASVSDIGGYYQLLPAADSFKGAYMLSVGNRFAPKSPISLVGSVDGSSFRTFNGTLDRATSQVVLGTRRGMLQDGRITWDMDEGTWQLQAAPAFQLVEAGAGAAFDGFYTDERYVQGSFAGTAMIAFDGPKRTGGFTMVGSDDGVAFWSVRGKFAAATGAVVVDASPWGGASRVNGTFAHGLLHLTSLDRTWTARARSAAAGGSEGVGYVAVAVAVLFFGTNFVPVKRFETGDGMFFQWVMCSAIFCWGLVLQLILFGLQPAGDCVPGVLGCRAALTNGRVDPYAVKFIPQAAAGGALWATGNTMVRAGSNPKRLPTAAWYVADA